MTAFTKSPLPWLTDALDALDAAGLRRDRHEARRLGGGRVERCSLTLLDFASNDYLGLIGDPRIRAASAAALRDFGSGSGASALVTGRSPRHVELERTIADFEGTDAAILFPTGYAANVGTLSALIGPRDVVFCDRQNHASLVDGCRLSGAWLKVYRFNQLGKLARHLSAARAFERRWIVTDGVFGMDGTIAPLPHLCDLADRYDAAVVVDEAHGTGVLGARGRGACEHHGVEHRIAARIGTLSKAAAALGGFVAGSADLIDFLWNHARTQMFSTALPPVTCAAAAEALRLIAAEPDRRSRAVMLADRLRDRLQAYGLDVPGDSGTPIVPVILGPAGRATAAGAELERRGFLVAAIRPPTVPHGTARLRISVSAAHTPEAIDALAGHLTEVCRP